VQPAPAASTPLQGIRVVELAADAIAVAVAGMQLGDLGALVVKLESPVGDPLRQAAADHLHEGERNAAYRELNRNKHTTVCDVERPEDRRMLVELVKSADVLLTDLPLESLRTLGVDYETMSGVNPALVVVQSSYFGRRGPFADSPGSELAVQAMSGLWECLGRLDAAPLRLGVESAETSGGGAMCQAVLAALVERESSGMGQLVETSALGATLALEGQMIGSHSPGNSGGGWHLPAPGLPEAHPVPTADFAVDFSMPDSFAFTELYRNLGVPDELSEDVRFTDKLALILNWPEFQQEVGPYFLQHPAEVVKELAYTFGGICVIANTFESLIADPQLEAMNVLAHAKHGPEAGSPIGVNPPWDFSLSRCASRREVVTCESPPTWDGLLGDERDPVPAPSR
jgi:crotonobetainyl-CoA:carnitine CoA-transferase CaiB-like acyl-CoA transferase